MAAECALLINVRCVDCCAIQLLLDIDINRDIVLGASLGSGASGQVYKGEAWSDDTTSIWKLTRMHLCIGLQNATVCGMSCLAVSLNPCHAGTFRGQEVAVKVLQAAQLGKSSSLKAFESEVAILSR